MPRNFKQARQLNKLKAIEAADKLGVSQPTLSAWEGERKSPSVESLEKMADLYGVTTDYLLGREENERIPLEGLTERERKQLFQIIQAYIDGLPPRSKQEKSR